MTGVAELYVLKDFPILQNRIYASAEEARNCRRGDIRFVRDLAQGLVYNAGFRSELIDYDTFYDDEQAGV